MATATSPTPRPPRSQQRVLSSSSSSNASSSVSTVPRLPTTPTTLARGATARSAVSPRVAGGAVSSLAKRASVRASPAAVAAASAEPSDERPATREALAANLKRETQEKEDLLLRVQMHEQTIADITTENANLTSTLNAAEIRLHDLYTEQGRMEEDMATKLQLIEKLRTQIRDAEKEKRDSHRRYTEQTQTFDAERQAFYDKEAHLKSRIQRLTQARSSAPTSPSVVNEYEDIEEAKEPEERTDPVPAVDESHEPAEMTSLRMELGTLSVSHTSLQNSVQLLQTELLDLKRVNNELQEENESYNILLRERTLNGSFDINRHRVASPEADDEKVEFPHDTRPASAAGRSGLDTLSEVEELVPPHRDESPARTPARSRKNSSRRGGSSSIRSGSPGRVGESLADLPVAGPGLDLAAEMGRAENKDMRAPPSSFDSEASAKKTKEGIIIERQEKQIRSLTDENRALSLYSSKILDRIISMDGFERVLAVDYEKQTPPPSQAPAPKPRSMLPRSLSISTQASSTAQFVTSPTPASPTPAPEMTKRARRGLSMDWTKSLWGGSSASSTLSSTVPDTKKLEGLRPFTLDPSNSVVRNAKKLDTQEDEEDRVERARLEATMKLMGIEKPVSASPILGVSPQVSRRTSPTPSLRSESGVAAPVPAPPPVPASIPLSARIPFFGRGKSEPAIPINNLTKEALTHATAESSLAALEARERILSAEIARGKNGGFTELGNYGSPRSSLSETRRRKRLGSGSGGSVSTLFSAGRMSRAGSTGGVEEENEQDTEVVAMMTETEVGAAPAPPS